MCSKPGKNSSSPDSVYRPFWLYFGLQLIIQATGPLARLLLVPAVLLGERVRKVSSSRWRGRPGRWLVGVGVLLLVARVVQFGVLMTKENRYIEDIAVANQRAAHYLFNGLNPYSHPTDHYFVDTPSGPKDYASFKYTPLQIPIYGLATEPMGPRGVYVLNFFSYFGIVALLFLVLRRQAGESSAWAGVIGLLLTGYFYVMAFNNGVNDFLPILLLLGGLAALQERRESLSGLLFGLSIAAKQLLGGLFLVPLVMQKRWRAVGVASATALLICLPFLIWDFNGFFQNAIEFNLIRPARGSSLIYRLEKYGLPKLLAKGVELSGFVFWIFFSWKGRVDRQWSLNTSWALPALGLGAFLLTAKMSGHHYWTWVTPFLVLWSFSQQDKATTSP